MKNHKAVRSFFGTSGQRPQEVYTPAEIRDALAELWPAGVSLDPCSGPDSIIEADVRLCLPGVLVGKSWVFEGPDEQNGLLQPWTPRTYVNPPFAELETWLAKARAEAARPGAEIVLLCPVRMSRRWYRAAWRTAAATIWCDYDLRFLGYKDAFPQAMCLFYWGSDPGLFMQAFSGVGEA